MARIYGIDLGHRAARLATFEGSFGRMSLVSYQEAPVAQDSSAPPDLLTRLAALDTLVGPLERHASDTWMVGFPTESASVRRIQLPFEDREKVIQALPFEVENQVPFDLDDMVLTHRILQTGPAGSTVLCGMAPTDAVSGLLDQLQERNLDPKALVVDADLLGHFADQGVQVVIDLGHTRTLLTLCHNGRVVGVRAVSRGGRDITLELVKALEVDFETAEAKKHVFGLGGEEALTVDGDWAGDEGSIDLDQWDEESTAGESVAPGHTSSGDEVAALVKRAFVPLLADIRASLIAFEDRQGLEIGEIILVGGGSRMAGVRTLLTDVLGVPVRTLQLDRGDGPQEAGATYALAHAAAARLGSTQNALLDLRVDAYAYRGNLAALGNIIRYTLLGAAALLLAATGFFTYRTVTLNSELAAVESQVADAVVAAFPDVNRDKVSNPSMAQAIMTEKTAETASRQAAIEAILPDEPPILSLMEAISVNVPASTDARIDVQELQISDATISIKAETDGFEDAAKIEASLQRYPRFKDARKGDEKKVKEVVRFTVTIPLESTDSEEG